MAKYILPTLLTAISMSLLSGCVTQSFENNEPIVKNQANRDEMAATRISLGLGYLKMGDMSQAKHNLEKAKRFSPNLVQVHTAFAHYYETVGESELAITSFEQALSIKADSADTLNNYGVFLCRQGKIAAAEEQFLKAIAVPSYLLVAQSYENLSSCYLQNDDFEKAEVYLSKAIFHSPNRTSTLLQMVRLQYAMTNYKEGKLFLQKFERNTQRFTADSLALAYKLNRKLGKRRTASNYANMLVKMYPQSWEGKQYLLNELEFIEADNLAKKYKFSQKEKKSLPTSSNNKRVVKLSPKKTVNTPVTPSVKTATVAASLPINTSNLTLGTGSSLVTGTTVLAAQATTSAIEPTSTKPIPAKRDVALPEALPVEEKVNEQVATHTVSNESGSSKASIQNELSSVVESASKVDTKLAVVAVATDDTIKNSEPLAKQETEQAQFHTVTDGENLYNISVKYNVKLQTLRNWNNLSEKNKIHVGSRIYVVDPKTVIDIND